MMQSSNLNLDLHHENELHASSSSIYFPSHQELILNNSISSPMVQELGFHWNIDGDSNLMNQESCIPKSNNYIKELGINLKHQDQYNIMLNPHIAKQEFDQINGLIQSNFEPLNFDDDIGRWSSQNANFSSLNYLSSLYSTCSSGMRQCSSTINDMNLLRENIDYGQLQESKHASTINNNNKVVPLSSISGVRELKRSSTTFNCKASQNHVPKKHRLDSRSSFTPFKVRKEKLGDRIATLQQLVAPFGKTDTASVLTEAIGYINFLQDQVQTLSMPYTNSSNSKLNDEENKDLRSRGLCLVPLSCMSCVSNESYEVWSPTNYNYCGGI